MVALETGLIVIAVLLVLAFVGAPVVTFLGKLYIKLIEKIAKD